MRNACLGALALTMVGAAATQAATVVALTQENALVSFDTETRVAGKPVAVSGIDGRLIGIDYRPKDGKLYGITDASTIYTIDPATGAATQVSKLKTPFVPGGRAAVDFNPQADRLRLLGATGISYRVNVDDGAVILDGMLRYGPNDANSGKQPFVVAAAYTNAMPNAKGTELIDLDLGAGVIALQSPPNDGVLQTRGRLMAGLGTEVAFDILLDTKDDNIGYVVAKGALHRIDLDSGKIATLGAVKGLPMVSDIAVKPVR